MPTIKGTASVPDDRARKKAMKKCKFPSSFSKPVDLQKVNRAVLTQWIEQKVTAVLGFDDEIVSSTAINLFLPAEGEDPPDPKRAQLDLTGFLGQDESAAFAKELWKLMLEAQESTSGIPKTLLDQKKKELAETSAKQQQNASAAQRSMHDYVQEAKNRARKAMQEHGGVSEHDRYNHDGNHPRNDGGRWQDRSQQAGPVPVPLSPTLDRERNNNSTREDDRKMPPQLDQFGRAIPANFRNSGPPQGNRGRPPHQPYPPGDSRRSRSRDGDHRGRDPIDDRRRPDYHYRGHHHHHRGGRDGGQGHYDDGWRRYDDRGPPPPRYDDRRQYDRRDRRYEDDREFEELGRRLAMLKKQFSRRSDDRRLEDEIVDIEDRLDELNRRRRRSSRERSNEGYRRKDDRGSPEGRRYSSRSRSPERSDRRKRGDSTDSDHSSASSRSRGSSGESDDDDDSSRSSRSMSSRSRSVSHSSRSRSRSISPEANRKGGSDRSRSGSSGRR